MRRAGTNKLDCRQVCGIARGRGQISLDRSLGALQRSGAKSFDEMERNFITQRRPTSIIQRFASPDEVASLIVYTAGTQSSATTGAALRVDGGVVKSAF